MLAWIIFRCRILSVFLLLISNHILKQLIFILWLWFTTVLIWIQLRNGCNYMIWWNMIWIETGLWNTFVNLCIEFMTSIKLITSVLFKHCRSGYWYSILYIILIKSRSSIIFYCHSRSVVVKYFLIQLMKAFNVYNDSI